MFGFVGCVEMKWKLIEKCILYFHIFENSNNLTVYLTDSCEFLISTVSLEKLRNLCIKLDIHTDNKILRVLKNSIKLENLHYDETEFVLNVTLRDEDKSCDLILKFSTVEKPEERGKHMKALLFNLARIVQDISSQHIPEKEEQVTASVTDHPQPGTTVSKHSSRSPVKRQGPPMSIINPGSRRIHQKVSKITYEEDDSDG